MDQPAREATKHYHNDSVMDEETDQERPDLPAERQSEPVAASLGAILDDSDESQAQAQALTALDTAAASRPTSAIGAFLPGSLHMQETVIEEPLQTSKHSRHSQPLPLVVPSERGTTDCRTRHHHDIQPGASRIYPIYHQESDEPTGVSDDYDLAIADAGVPVTSQQATTTSEAHTDYEHALLGMTVMVEQVECVQAKPVDGIYIRRRYLLGAGLALAVCIGITGAIVAKTTRREMPTPASSGVSVSLHSMLEKLANSLPPSTQNILRHELDVSDQEHPWYKHGIWTAEDEFQPCTPQGKAFQWLASDPRLESRSLVDLTDRFALATLFYATDGPNWISSTNWLSYTEHVCNWRSEAAESPYDHETYMRICLGSTSYNSDGPGLKQLSLSNNALDGPLPLELSLIQGLILVRLSGNSLRGTIPELVWEGWRRVQSIQLEHNALSGTLPTLLGLFSNLNILYLDNNRFSGSLPKEIGNSARLLTDFSIFNNLLTGELPSSVAKLSTLKYFQASYNHFTGSIPPGLFTLEHLMKVSLGNNLLSGDLPLEIGSSPRLRTVDAANNMALIGPLPTEIGQLALLESLMLGNCSLTGTIPSQMSQASSLLILDLSNTRIEGTLATELGQLTQLTNLRLMNTDVSGRIPSSVCHAFTALDATSGIVIDCAQVECECGCTCG